MVYLTNHIGDYPGICQGKTRINGVNDGEEFELTDVSWCVSESVNYNTHDHRSPAPNLICNSQYLALALYICVYYVF